MKLYKTFLIALGIVVFNSCLTEEGAEEITDTPDYSDWTEATHSNNADPNYSIVFNQNEVLRFDIVISSENWAAMQSDLTRNLTPPPGGPGGPPPGPVTGFTPVWKPCAFHFNGRQWYNAGIRFKGNSSLRSAYQTGIKKLSFKLDFDQFEDDYPQLKNQRFYGFKQLNLNNNFSDHSLMREKVASDLFRSFSMVSAQTAFCTVYVDHGTGPKYFGLYTLVEEMDDTVLKSQLGNDSGNLYKPEGPAASFAQGSFNPVQMNKQNNQDLYNYSDVRALYDIINSNKRTTDPSSWKTELSGVFNVDVFLRWLAANTIIQNWDTYGKMSQNYYLYHHPDNGMLTWIPWDLNEALQQGKQGGALSLSMDEVGKNWPLIRYLIDDKEYFGLYKKYLQEFIDDVFIPEKMKNLYSSNYVLIKSHVYAEEPPYSFIRNDAEFDNSVEMLKMHVQSQNNAVRLFLTQMSQATNP